MSNTGERKNKFRKKARTLCTYKARANKTIPPSFSCENATSLCTKEAEVTFVSNEAECKIFKKPSPAGEGVERSETDEVF